MRKNGNTICIVLDMKKIIIFISAAFIIASCNSTKITSSWKADSGTVSTTQKIMVLGIINQKDRTLRTELEKQLVANLLAKGYKAASAMDEYGPKAFDKVSEDEIVQKLKSSGYDAVLTVVLLDKSKDQYYRPGTVSYQPVGIRRFGRYYTTIYDRVYDPGYYTNTTEYFLESNLYNIGNSDLIYSAQSKAVDPSSLSALGKDYSKTIVQDMVKQKVLN